MTIYRDTREVSNLFRMLNFHINYCEFFRVYYFHRADSFWGWFQSPLTKTEFCINYCALSVELKFDLFLYYTAWICWHFNFAINVWDHKLLWYFIYKLWTLYNFCHAGCWHILLKIKKKMCCQRPVKCLLLCLHYVKIFARTSSGCAIVHTLRQILFWTFWFKFQI